MSSVQVTPIGELRNAIGSVSLRVRIVRVWNLLDRQNAGENYAVDFICVDEQVHYNVMF
jgi:very-short-patch-repair endonuclease